MKLIKINMKKRIIIFIVLSIIVLALSWLFLNPIIGLLIVCPLWFFYKKRKFMTFSNIIASIAIILSIISFSHKFILKTYILEASLLNCSFVEKEDNLLNIIVTFAFINRGNQSIVMKNINFGIKNIKTDSQWCSLENNVVFKPFIVDPGQVIIKELNYSINKTILERLLEKISVHKNEKEVSLTVTFDFLSPFSPPWKKFDIMHIKFRNMKYSGCHSTRNLNLFYIINKWYISIFNLKLAPSFEKNR
ncbi:hypothetical protein ACFL1F_00070 [Chlamydiota bacterium]